MPQVDDYGRQNTKNRYLDYRNPVTTSIMLNPPTTNVNVIEHPNYSFDPVPGQIYMMVGNRELDVRRM